MVLSGGALVVGPDNGVAVVHCHCPTQVRLVAHVLVLGGELLLVGPGGAAAAENVGRTSALVGSAILDAPGQGGVAVQTHGPAQVVVPVAVRGGVLVRLGPGGARAVEDVGRPRAVGNVIAPGYSRDQPVPVQGYVIDRITARNVAMHHSLLLAPDGTATGVDIDRRAVPPDGQGISVHGHDLAEVGVIAQGRIHEGCLVGP